jgi:ubiquinone/menaquinone biosynthesis C-methylase UbiE
MDEQPAAPADFYTGLVAEMYAHLRSETFDPEPFILFVERWGQPALELGCGDGEPLLALVDHGLDVDGLDSSADMLARCAASAKERGLDVTLHHARFETMDLDRSYRSLFLAGATFNLISDDDAARAALGRIAAHLEPGGAAMIPLFVPQVPTGIDAEAVREIQTDDGRTMRLVVGSIERNETARVQTTQLRYELDDGESTESTERDWVLHWFDQDTFQAMVDSVGLRTIGVYRNDEAPSTTHDTAFTFVVQRSFG